MKLIGFIVTLIIISQASHQGFVGTRSQPQQETHVTEDFSSTEENLYSSSTNPTTYPVTEASEAATDLDIDSSQKDEDETDDTTIENPTLEHVLNKRFVHDQQK